MGGNELFKKIRTTALFVMKSSIRLIERMIPKNRHLIIIGGPPSKYSDNSRYLFEYLLSQEHGLHVVWLTTSKAVEKKLRETHGRDKVARIPTLRAIWTFWRAKTAIFSHGYWDFGWLMTARAKKTKMCLWHGIPMKKLGFASPSVIADKTASMNARSFSHLDFLAASSPLEAASYHYCFNIDASRDVVQPTGMPRNDALITNAAETTWEEKQRFIKGLLKNAMGSEQVILYAPTWRADGKIRFFPWDDFDIKQLQNLLQENNAILLVRGHINDLASDRSENASDLAAQTPRIIAYHQDAYPDVQDMLHLVDIVISDYSGIWADFLLLDRPIVLVPYDLDEYMAHFGLLYPLDLFAPGAVVQDFDGFLKSISDYIADPSLDSEIRRQKRRWFHTHQDARASERILNWLCHRLDI